MKTKRKDTYKNRNKPTSSWPRNQRYRSIDGTPLNMVLIVEEQKAVIGMVCGRCGAEKKPDHEHHGRLKCPNRVKENNLIFCK